MKSKLISFLRRVRKKEEGDKMRRAESMLLEFLEQHCKHSILVASSKVSSHFIKMGYSNFDFERAFKSLVLKERICPIDQHKDYVKYVYFSYKGKRHFRINFEREKNVCSDCGSNNIILDKVAGENVCANCGLVLKQNVMVPNWKEVNPPTDPLYVDDTHGIFLRFIGSPMKRKIYSVIYTGKELHLKRYFLPILRLVCDKLLTPSHIRRYAATIYIQAIDHGIFRRGVHKKPFIAASLYFAYRAHRSPILLSKICIVSQDSSQSVQRAFRQLVRGLDIRLPIQTVEDFIPLVISNINVPSEKRTKLLFKTMRLLKDIREGFPSLIFGKSPLLLAGVLTYIAGKQLELSITQWDIAIATDTYTETISRILKRIHKGVDLTPRPVPLPSI